MRKIFILMAMTIAVFSSCVDNDDNPMPTATVVEQAENRTEDALSVTSDHSYVMYGEFDEEFGNALGRRMQGTMTSPSMADVFVVDPSAVSKSDIMSTEELKTMIQRTESGEASVVLTKATFREFYDWAQLYVLGYLLMELENYSGDLGYDSPKAAPARRRMANVMRNAYMAGQPQTAATRGTTVNGMELDWEHVDSWPAEKQNAVMFDGFAQSGDNELFVMNAAATLNAEAEVEQPKNDYEWGHKADAVADWLNSQDAEKAQSRAGLKRLARAATRAGGSAAINDLMSAQTKEFVFDYKLPGIWNTSIWTAYSAITVQYTAYSVYDFKNNVDYYQVRQNIKVNNNKIHFTQNSSWYSREDGDYTLGRGAWMKRIDTKMWLEGSGKKLIKSYSPENENGTSSGSCSTGGSSSSTTGYSEGYSVGVSAGTSIGLTGPSASLSASYGESYTKSYSTTDGITWSTTTSWSTKHLKTTYLGDNNTASWKHDGHTPTTIDGDTGTSSDKIKDLLKGPCTTDEQVIWMVTNPSGTYTLKASFNVVNEICKIKWNGSSYDGAFVTQDNPHDISFVLNTPDRYKQTWNCYVINSGSTTPKELREYLEPIYGASSDNHCWAGHFTSTEATADGSDNARAVFQTFKNSIRGMKDELRQNEYSGRIVFGLKPNGADAYGDAYDPIDSVALVLDGTGYNVGETFTEKLNGYRLTYKVTKKGSEVELSSVPKDFSGVLNIPEKVSEGVLTVTSLASHCAQGRTGITAVTIPSTVSIIKVGALEKLGITEINIPEGVKTLSPWSFHYNTQLTKVYLPSTLETIYDHAFYNNNMLAEVHIKATTPPALGNYVFNPRYNYAVLYVPKGYKDTYANTGYWKNFKNIVEE